MVHFVYILFSFCGLEPSVPSRPLPPPLLLGEAGELELLSSVRMKDKRMKNERLITFVYAFSESILFSP